MAAARPARPAAWLAVCLMLVGARPVAGGEPIRLTERVPVEAAELFLQVRGADRNAPVILWLHGGPGGAERPLFRMFNGSLERYVVSAYLDQRGAGRSFDAEADPELLTIDTHLADLNRVIHRLFELLERRPVVLLGHSWGGALALLYAQTHPQHVSHVIAVAPLIDTRAAWLAEYEYVRAEAARRDDRRALRALLELRPPPYTSADELLAVERLADRFGALFHRPMCLACVIARGTVRGLVAPWDILRFVRGNQVSLRAMHGELSALNLFERVPRLDVPITFLLGRYDRHVSSDVAAAYADALQAPDKRVVWFEESAHNVPFEEPERFHAAVLDALGIRGDDPAVRSAAQRRRPASRSRTVIARRG